MFGLDDLLSGGMSMFGTMMTNQANKDMLASQQQFSAAQAKQQMDFQEKMSNTSYQRGMADMKAAGLNPILAYQKGGASSPTGAMAGTPAAQPMADPIGSGISSARAHAALSANLDQVRQQTATGRAEELDKKASANQRYQNVVQSQAETSKIEVQKDIETNVLKKAMAEGVKADWDASVFKTPVWQAARQLGLLGSEASSAISPVVSGVGSLTSISRAASAAKAAKFKDRFYFGDDN